MTYKVADAAPGAAPESEVAPEAAAEVQTETPPAETEDEKAWKEFASAEKPEPGKDADNQDDETPPAEQPEDTQPAKGRDPKTGQFVKAKGAQAKGAEQPAGASGDQPQAGRALDEMWRTAPDHLRKAYTDLAKETDDLRHYRQSQIGRHASFQRRIAELTAEIGNLKKGSPEASKVQDATWEKDDKKPQQDGTQGTASPELPPALKKAIEEYPEVAAPLAEIIGQQAKVIEDLKKTVSDLAKSKDDGARNDFIKEQTEALNAAHPDWNKLTGVSGDDEKSRQESANKFTAWVNTQPRYVQEAAAANGDSIVDAEAAIHLIGLYKAHLRASGQPTQPPSPGTQGSGASPKPSAPDPKRVRQLESASVPRTPSPGITPAAGIPDDPEQAFRYFARHGV